VTRLKTGAVSAAARAASPALRRRSVWVAAGLLSACGSTSRHPTLPPPEYERPAVIPWGPKSNTAAAGAERTEGTDQGLAPEARGGTAPGRDLPGATSPDIAPVPQIQTETEGPMSSGGAANAR